MRQIIFLNELNRNAETALGAMAGAGNSSVFTDKAKKLSDKRNVDTSEKVESVENTDAVVANRGSYATTAVGGQAVGGLLKAGKTKEANELIGRLRDHKQRLKTNPGTTYSPSHSNSSLTQDVFNTAREYGGRYVKSKR